MPLGAAPREAGAGPRPKTLRGAPVGFAGAPPVFGHLFKVRHHAIIENDKITSLLGWRPRYDVVSGHRHTYEWFQAQGWAELDTTLADPVWKASWDFAAEAALVERIRRG